MTLSIRSLVVGSISILGTNGPDLVIIFKSLKALTGQGDEEEEEDEDEREGEEEDDIKCPMLGGVTVETGSGMGLGLG